jgi:hypothetical protein
MPKTEYGVAGLSLRRRGLLKVAERAGPLFGACALFLVYGLAAMLHAVPPWTILPVFVLELVAVGLLPKWIRRADSEIDPLLTGLQGEQDLADALRKTLGDDFYLIHDLVIGNGNVDHVVVAPAGIFTVETKAILGKVETHGDTMRVNGYDHTDYLRQAYAEAMIVRDYLYDMPGGRKYFVTPLVAFTRANVSAQGQCRGVYAMRVERVGKFVSYNRERLDWKARSRVAAALNLRTTEYLSGP